MIQDDTGPQPRSGTFSLPVYIANSSKEGQVRVMITAVHHFPLRGLGINSELLGANRKIRFEEHDCEILFPKEEYDFIPAPVTHFYGQGSLRMVAKIGGKFDHGDVYVIEVRVSIDSNLKSSDFLTKDKIENDRFQEEARILWHKSADIARRLVGRINAEARINKGQYWLEPEVNLPPVIYQSALYDDSNQRIPLSTMDPVTVSVHTDSKNALGNVMFDEIVEAVEKNTQLDLPEMLLANAKFHSWESSSADLAIGLILAATACEAKIKSFLTNEANPDQQKLVELLINSPNDFTASAITLFDKGLEALGLVSFRSSDMPLFKELTELFAERNAVVHKRKTFSDKAKLSGMISAAVRAFDLLESMRAHSSLP